MYHETNVLVKGQHPFDTRNLPKRPKRKELFTTMLRRKLMGEMATLESLAVFDSSLTGELDTMWLL